MPPSGLPERRHPLCLRFSIFYALVAHFQPLTIGKDLPDAPLFIHSERYINASLEVSYLAAYRGVPGFVKETLDHSTGVCRSV